MTTALSPDDALLRLAELAPGVREAVVLDAAGGLLAGAAELAEPAAALVRAADAAAVEVGDERGAVYALRGDGYAVVAVVDRPVLPALMLYDLRSVLADLERPRAA
jgi:hypothetical protein